jgi:hypothetical protein
MWNTSFEEQPKLVNGLPFKRYMRYKKSNNFTANQSVRFGVFYGTSLMENYIFFESLVLLLFPRGQQQQHQQMQHLSNLSLSRLSTVSAIASSTHMAAPQQPQRTAAAEQPYRSGQKEKYPYLKISKSQSLSLSLSQNLYIYLNLDIDLDLKISIYISISI